MRHGHTSRQERQKGRQERQTEKYRQEGRQERQTDGYVDGDRETHGHSDRQRDRY